METVNALLNLPGSAGSSERALALSELLTQHDNIQARRYEAEDKLCFLRAETAALFTETLSATRGVTDEDALKDAADMWREASVQAAAAFMGADIVTAANPWGCNQYGHRKGHQPGKPGKQGKQNKGGNDENKPREESAGSEESEEKIVDSYLSKDKDEQWQQLSSWRREVNEAKNKALDIQESTKYRQKDKDTVDAYEKAKKEANKKAKRLRERVRRITVRRGVTDAKKIDKMLDKNYPETLF